MVRPLSLYYLAAAFFCCFHAAAANATDHSPGTRDVHDHVSAVPLATPYMDVYAYHGEQNNIYITFYNNNPGSNTEIWRSQDDEAHYQLIATVPASVTEYQDNNIKPRTLFYYKVRAVSGTEVSGFSDPYYQRTASKNYPPTFTARAIDENTVELTITDNSYNDVVYYVYGTNNDFYQEVSMQDSGRTETITHHPAPPGTTLNYSLDFVPWYDQTQVNNYASTTVTTPGLASCAGVGSIEREKWNNLSGYPVSSIPTSTNPDEVIELESFDAPVNNGDKFGVRMRALVCVPQTGKYTFWISSDDNSELYLSTGEDPSSKRLIASSKWTAVGQWNKYPSQQSAQIDLVAGNRYYIEALHTEVGGDDHLSVGWKLPDGTLERPIPGKRLIRFPRGNYLPAVKFTSPAEGQTFTSPATVHLAVDAHDPDGTVTSVYFYSGNQLLGSDRSAPFTLDWQNVPAGTYTLEARAYDDLYEDYSTAQVHIDVKPATPCTGAGTITRQIWRNVSGTEISSIPLDEPPTSYEQYTVFETKQYVAENYGSRMQAWLCVPQNGNYTFWISSDDKSELYLSTDESIENKKLIASVNAATKFQQYDKFASQKSATIPLKAGYRYYIEAIHKEVTGNDFISVGWQLPDGTMERPIKGSHLVPYTGPHENYHPIVTITEPAEGHHFTAPAHITFRATAYDPDGSVRYVQFFDGINKITEDWDAPYIADMFDVPAGTYHIVAKAYDNGDEVGMDTVTFIVDEARPCEGTGSVVREMWTNIPGTSVSNIPLDTPPNRTSVLTSLSTPNYTANQYGDRIRGYLCVPQDGAYVFRIASDDDSELWLSYDESPDNKIRIAYLYGAVKPGDYTRYASQTAAPFALIPGRRYYFEILHKDGDGADFVSVSWQLPDGTVEAPIPGNRLIPYDDPEATAMAARTIADPDDSESKVLSLFPNPVAPGRDVSVTLTDKSYGADARLEVISVNGKVVHTQTVSCTDDCEDLLFTLDGGVAPGLYMVNVYTNRRKLSRLLQVK